MKSLKTIILASIVGLTLFTAAVYLSIAVFFSNKAVRDIFKMDVENMTQIISEAIADENDMRMELLTNLSTLPIIRNPDIPMKEKQIQLNDIAAKDSNIFSLYLSDTMGTVVSLDDKVTLIANRTDFMHARTGTPSIYGPVEDGKTGLFTVYYSVPVYDFDNKIIAVLSISGSGKVLSQICDEYIIGENTHPFIFEKYSGLVYGDSNYQNVLEKFNYKTEAEKKNYKGLSELLDESAKKPLLVSTFSDNKKIYYYAFSAVENTSWGVAAIIPQAELNAKTRNMRINMLVFSFYVIISGLIIAFILAKAMTPLKVLGNTVVDIGSGNADLTKRLELKHVKREIGDVVNGFNNFVGKLQEIITQVRFSEERLSKANLDLQNCSENTSASIEQIISNIRSVTSEIENETNSVNETASAVHQIASNIQSLEKMINSQANSVEEATSAVEEMVGNINSVNSSVNAMVESFKTLEENAKEGILTQSNVNEKLQKIDEESKMLQEANAVISAIAEQTNLLAMNAAIEAAHAGEAGKGFSVVADEIRKLSETSSTQSESIGQELQSIQSSINYVVSESAKASNAFTSVAENIKRTDEVIQLIRGAMEEQQIGSKQITEALYAMNNSTTEVRAAAEEMSQGNEQILTEVQILQAATGSVNSRIQEMEAGANNINSAGIQLVDITKNVSESVDSIHHQIGQFKV